MKMYKTAIIAMEAPLQQNITAQIVSEFCNLSLFR